MTYSRTPRRFKLAYITVHLPGAASGEEFFRPEIRELAKLNYSLVLVPRETVRRGASGFDADQAIVAKAVALGSAEVIREFLKTAFRDWRLTLAIARECCTGAKPVDMLKNLRVLPKGIWLGRLVQRESIDHIHAQWGATTATLAEIAHRVSGIPWSLTLHRGDIVQNNRLRQKVASASFTRFISRDGVRLYEEVTGRDPSIDGNVKVIHMGVAIPPPSALDVHPRTRPFKLVCAANLVPVKGHAFLFQAIGLLRERGVAVRLFVVGEGVLRTQLEELVRVRGLEEWVTFMGQQSHNALLNSYRERMFHAVVLASIDLGRGLHEGIPMSLVEGMAFGLPVVSTATGGIPELLARGAGLLVPPRNPTALADAIAELANNHELAVETGRRGRERVVAEFDISRIVEILSEAFDDSLVPSNTTEETHHQT